MKKLVALIMTILVFAFLSVYVFAIEQDYLCPRCGQAPLEYKNIKEVKKVPCQYTGDPSMLDTVTYYYDAEYCPACHRIFNKELYDTVYECTH